MQISLNYPHESATGAPRSMGAETIWAVAAQLRRHISREDGALGVTRSAIVAATAALSVNARAIATSWDFDHDVHDGTGQSVLGVCETDPGVPGVACISVNRDMVVRQPELTLSTIAHELGHVVFDVPMALGGAERRYRSITKAPDALVRGEGLSERRANEFMGALLVPSVALHTRLLALARSERMRLARAPHRGRPGSPVLARDNASIAIAGIVAVAASEFGVSDRFIAVRIKRYGLIEGGNA